jgi:hypothetical protein
MSLSSLLIHQCVIEEYSEGTAATGEPTKTWAAKSGGTVNCRFMYERESFADESGGAVIATITKVVVPAGTDVSNQDRINDITLRFTGGTVVTGPFEILEVLPRYGKRAERLVALEVEKVV